MLKTTIWISSDLVLQRKSKMRKHESKKNKTNTKNINSRWSAKNWNTPSLSKRRRNLKSLIKNGENSRLSSKRSTLFLSTWSSKTTILNENPLPESWIKNRKPDSPDPRVTVQTVLEVPTQARRQRNGMSTGSNLKTQWFRNRFFIRR